LPDGQGIRLEVCPRRLPSGAQLLFISDLPLPEQFDLRVRHYSRRRSCWKAGFPALPVGDPWIWGQISGGKSEYAHPPLNGTIVFLKRIATMFGNWFVALASRRPSSCPGRRQRHQRLDVEGLEERCLLSGGGLDALNQSYVYRLYEDLLFRIPDAGGLSFFQNQVAAGSNRVSMAMDMELSPEYETLLVQNLYGALLGRAPDATGQTSDLAFLSGGGSVEQLEASILGSPEYFQNRGGGTNAGFLNAVYQDILGRTIDPSGANSWGAILASSTSASSRQTVAYQIVTSLENEQGFLKSCYQRFLHRNPDAAGMASWTDVMQNGMTERPVIANFIGSMEFFDNATPVTTATTISGVVEDANGNPVVGAPVSVGNAQAVTGADGSFTVTLSPYSVMTESSAISVPKGDLLFDPFATGTQTIPMRQDLFDPNSGTDTNSPRLNPNEITSFIDGSMIYGSDPARAAALRTFVGGQLKTSPGDLLPLNNTTYFPNGPLANDNLGPDSPNTLFVAGDVRSNENITLTALQTLFVREHNYWAQQYQSQHPDWTDEQLYQAARRMVIAEIEHITYDEFLPQLLGPSALGPYNGYDPTVDPTISSLFSTAAYRFGRSLIPSNFTLPLDGGGSLPSLSLDDSTFNPQPLIQDGLDPFLLGMATQGTTGTGLYAVNEIRNMLFGPPGSGGIDLIAVDIQRGRDLGLPSYNQARQLYGLPAVTSFAQITSDPTVQAQLQAVYGSVNNIDVFVGGMAEDHVPGAMLGPLFEAIIKDQFQRLRAGDRFWYENGQFTSSELAQIRSTSLADIIERNTAITGLQANVFTTGGTALPAPDMGGFAAASDPTAYRSADGTGNNLGNPTWGSTGDDLRVVGGTMYYGDGVASPGGANLPNPRTISNALFVGPPVMDPSQPSVLFTMWGQFMDHDLDLTHDGYPNSLTVYGPTQGSSPTFPAASQSLSLLLGHDLYQGMNNVINQPIVLSPA
jgi:hypothetical protein